jgi:tetratricopeptide (TPR) repeat protein
MKNCRLKAYHVSYRAENKIHADFFIQVICFLVLSFGIASCSLPRIVLLEDPLSAEEHLNLGVTYEKNGELDNALEEYKKASKTIPLAYTYIGNIFFKKGELKDAEVNYKRAIKEEPYPADACNNLAWLYYTEKKNLEEAEKLTLKAIQLDPSKKDIYQDTLEKIRELKRATK